MNKTIIYSINDYLIRAIESSYLKAKKDVVKNIRKYIVTGKTSQMVTGKSFNEKIFHDKNFSDKLPEYLSTDYNETDKKFLDNFRKEVFTVACVGTYDLEEKMKEVAQSILELPESDTRDRKKLFVRESQDLLDQYLPDGEKIPPAGWLKTNLQTAVNSSYNASQWVKLQDPAVRELYPAYKYKTREDSHVRQEHAILNNAVYKSDDIIWKKIYPPNGWNCRCYINYLSAEDIQEPGNKPNDLTIDPAEVSRLVKEAKIPPDFQRNSGIDGHIYDKWTKAKLKDMPEEVVRETKKLVTEYAALLNAGKPADVPPTVTYGKSKFIPKNLPVELYNIVPDKIYDTIGDFNLKILSGKNSTHWEQSNRALQINISQWSGVKTTITVNKSIYRHEVVHPYHHAKGIVTHTYVDEKVIKFRDNISLYINKAFEIDESLKEVFATKKGMQDFENIDDAREYLVIADVVKAVTKGKYGDGHSEKYFSAYNHREMEILANTGSIYFDLIDKGVGNKYVNKHLPKLNEMIKEYWNEELK